ncbi:MAG: nucleotidyltransferase domain-containing protein [Chloroflexi bacterium]|nr:nucleotidyltransferase domain-containing protein [Chloroflexota bacterium]
MNHCETEPVIQRLLHQARDDPQVLAVMLFGSRARGEQRPDSDVDVCLVLQPGPYERPFLTEKRLDYLAHHPVDVQVFQDLPLYVRRRVLKDGRLLFCRDEDTLYETALRTARAFEDFRPLYQAYLAEVARAGR